MIESIVIVTIAGLFVLAFSKYMEYRKFKRVRDEIISNITQIEEHIRDHLVVLRVEKVDGVMYAYKHATGEFVAQGVDLDEMDKQFKERFPGKKGVVIEGSEYIVEFLKEEKANV